MIGTVCSGFVLILDSLFFGGDLAIQPKCLWLARGPSASFLQLWVFLSEPARRVNTHQLSVRWSCPLQVLTVNPGGGKVNKSPSDNAARTICNELSVSPRVLRSSSHYSARVHHTKSITENKNSRELWRAISPLIKLDDSFQPNCSIWFAVFQFIAFARNKKKCNQSWLTWLPCTLLRGHIHQRVRLDGDAERKSQQPERARDGQLKLQTRLCLKRDLTLITILSAHSD